MPPTIIRRNDPFDRRSKMKRDATVIALLTLVHGLALPVFLIWNGGFIGVGVVLVMALIVAIWAWIESALSKSRMRKRLRAAASQPLADGDDADRPEIDAWLLVNGSLGVGIHRQSQQLYVFKGKKRPDRFSAKDFHRMTAQRQRGLFGRWRDILFLSDAHAGPGLELQVTEGDLQGFLQHVER